MGKIIKLADGGSFFRRPSSFLKVPKFQPTQLDIPDIKGLMLLSEQSKVAAPIKPEKPKEFDFKIPQGITGLTGRKSYYVGEYNKLLNQYYSNVENIEGYLSSTQRDRDAQAIENFWPSISTALKNEKDSFDKVNNSRLATSDDYFVGSSGGTATVYPLDQQGNPIPMLDANGNSTGQIGTVEIGILEWMENPGKYSEPLTNQGYQDYEDVYGSFGAFSKNARAERVHPATIEETLKYMRDTLAPTKGGGNQYVDFGTLGEFGANPASFEANPMEFFEVVRRSMKSNVKNINAAVKLLDNMPETYRKTLTGDWMRKIRNTTFKGDVAQYYASLINNTALTYLNEDKSITIPSGGSGSGLDSVEGALAWITQSALGQYEAVADAPNHPESFWQESSTGEIILTEKVVHDLRASKELIDAISRSAGNDYNSVAYTGGTLVDWRQISGAIDSGKLIGLKWVQGLDGEPASLYIEKIVYVTDDIDEKSLTLYKPKFGIVEAIEKGQSVLTNIYKSTVFFMATGGGTYKPKSVKPIITAEKDEVFKSWGYNNLKSAYQDKSVFKEIKGDNGSDIIQEFNMSGDELFAVKVMEPLTVSGIQGLGLSTAAQDKLVDLVTQRANLFNAQRASIIKQGIINNTP